MHLCWLIPRSEDEREVVGWIRAGSLASALVGLAARSVFVARAALTLTASLALAS